MALPNTNHTPTIRLRLDIRNEIIQDSDFALAIGKAAGGKSYFTIVRWCKANAETLTMLSVLNAVRKYKNLPDDCEVTEDIALQLASAVAANKNLAVKKNRLIKEVKS